MDDDRPSELAQPGEPPRGPISPRLTTKTRVTHNLRVPMRDGVELSLDLLRPDLPGPLPVVLIRTPYDKTTTRASRLGTYQNIAERGYIVAFNDCRGRFNSDGAFRPYFDDTRDGHDTVEWIAAQPWCDGSIGMLGGSYNAMVQWYAAAGCSPHLKAIVPYCSQPGSLWGVEPFVGGCFLLVYAEWMLGMGDRSWQMTDFANDLFVRQRDYYEALPLSELPRRAGISMPWWDSWMDHPVFDDFWQQGSYENHADMTVAALNVTGWWDMDSPARR